MSQDNRAGRKVKILDVTPEIATRWLETTNTHNRDLRQGVVDTYAEAMKRGEWKLTAEPVAFCHPWTDSQNNRHPETLIEGQHRLWAIVTSGCTVPLTVWFGCDPEEFGVIGQGVVRSQGDVLQITRRDIKDPTKVATVVSAVLRYMFSTGSRTMTWQTELMLRHFQREIEVVVDFKRRLGKLAPKEAQAALFAGVLIDEGKTATLVERLHSAIGFTERDPVRALHNYLHNQLNEQFPDAKEALFYKTLHAVIATIDERPIQKLQPLVDHMGEARRRMKDRIEGVVRQLHGGRLPMKFFDPRNSLRPVSERGAVPMAAAAK